MACAWPHSPAIFRDTSPWGKHVRMDWKTLVPENAHAAHVADPWPLHLCSMPAPASRCVGRAQGCFAGRSGGPGGFCRHIAAGGRAGLPIDINAAGNPP